MKCKFVYMRDMTSNLSVRQRLALYVSCVRSCAIYGLIAVGFTYPSFEMLRVMEQRHIRSICRSQRHKTFENTKDLCARHSLLEPDSLKCLRSSVCSVAVTGVRQNLGKYRDFRF